MKSSRSHRILLLAALLHLAAEAAAAGGAVLCVGPNDHQAIELGHSAQGCEPPDEAAAVVAHDAFAANPAADLPDCADCVDTPLHADAEMAPGRDVQAAMPHLVLVDAAPAPPATPWTRERGDANHLDLSPTMRAHRSIVLLI